MGFNFTLTSIVFFAVFIFVLVVFIASRYKRCPSNRVLVVFGKVSGGKSARCLHGGGAFVWPLIQDYRYLDLTPMTINIPLKGALSQQNIRVNVPSTFTVAIATEEDSMDSAAVRLLGLQVKDIESMATEIILGQLRLTVASLTIEQINQDRERFLEAIRKNIDIELDKIGLCLINVNVTDITDESGYIESIGKRAAFTAINQAKVDVAEQDKKGAIGEAEAKKDQQVRVANFNKEQRIQIADFNAKAVEGENTSKADIAASAAILAEKQAEAERRGQVAQQEAEAAIQKSKALAEQRRLEAMEVVPREIEKRKVEIDAAAHAEQQRLVAKGEADAILLVRSAEAEGIKKVLEAKALGYQTLVQSANNDAKSAATLLLVEKLEDIVKAQTEAIKNIKIDKITVWDSPSADGSSTSNFMRSLVKTLPPLHEIAKQAGLDLPGFLGSVEAVNADKNEAAKVGKDEAAKLVPAAAEGK
jgi:flotillin